MAQLNLDKKLIQKCRDLAEKITIPVEAMIQRHTTVSIERASLRLLGMNDATKKGDQFFPQVNLMVEQVHQKNALGRGILYWFANAMTQKKSTVHELAKTVASGKINLTDLPMASEKEIHETAKNLCKNACENLDESAWNKKKSNFNPTPPTPLKYVIVATGNIFEDVTQATAAADAGADAIAVIRSTAQSLLDYIPHGATTEGFGGTYATQENFRIMRKALDEKSEKLGRYIYLTNYCSGLCMPEIAAIGALERLDFLLNDAMYGILFRDINMKRTLTDQHFSRRILARSKTVIQTGEDNYLTTADAIKNGHEVLASQFINERGLAWAGACSRNEP